MLGTSLSIRQETAEALQYVLNEAMPHLPEGTLKTRAAGAQVHFGDEAAKAAARRNRLEQWQTLQHGHVQERLSEVVAALAYLRTNADSLQNGEAITPDVLSETTGLLLLQGMRILFAGMADAGNERDTEAATDYLHILQAQPPAGCNADVTAVWLAAAELLQRSQSGQDNLVVESVKFVGQHGGEANWMGQMAAALYAGIFRLIWGGNRRAAGLLFNVEPPLAATAFAGEAKAHTPYEWELCLDFVWHRIVQGKYGWGECGDYLACHFGSRPRGVFCPFCNKPACETFDQFMGLGQTGIMAAFSEPISVVLVQAEDGRGGTISPCASPMLRLLQASVTGRAEELRIQGGAERLRQLFGEVAGDAVPSRFALIAQRREMDRPVWYAECRVGCWGTFEGNRFMLDPEAGRVYVVSGNGETLNEYNRRQCVEQLQHRMTARQHSHAAQAGAAELDAGGILDS